MDPEEAYRQLCEVMEALQRNEGDAVAMSIDAQRAVEYWEALDGWLSRGGFLPKPWRKWREEARVAGEQNAVAWLPDADERARQRGLGTDA